MKDITYCPKRHIGMVKPELIEPFVPIPLIF